MILFTIFLFLISLVVLFWAGSLLIKTLIRIAKFLGWREFVIAFFVVAFATSTPNLFLGISSILHKIPQLSFGDIVGGNIIDLTLAVALATFFAKGGLLAKSRMVQTSAVFTMVIAILPLFLILDGVLSRGDGIILIFCFFFYVFWLFSKKERFTKVYNSYEIPALGGFRVFLKDLGKIILGIALLSASAEGIVRSAQFFAQSLNLPIALVGILIVGLGNALPETYFAIFSARKGQTWMILGNLMGSVIVPATLILGIVALISPIEISDFSPFAIARFFLIISAFFFLFFARTDQKITKKEALFLLFLYLLFVVLEILI